MYIGPPDVGSQMFRGSPSVAIRKTTPRATAKPARATAKCINQALLTRFAAARRVFSEDSQGVIMKRTLAGTLLASLSAVQLIAQGTPKLPTLPELQKMEARFAPT